MNRRTIAPTVLGAVLLSASLAGCGNKSGGTSQVVAKVGENEITVSQLSQALHTRGLQTAGPDATKQAVESLINEQLLVQSALDSKLDRDPAVVQALERARRQVLARAYVERMVFPTEEISAAEQVEYYKKHPELFEKRRMFQVKVYTVKAADVTEEVRTQLLALHTPEEIEKVLASRGIAHESQSLTRGTEQLPFEDLPRFAAAKEGDLVIMQPQESRVPMMLVQAIHESPIGVDRAQPIIQQYLVNTRNAKALDEHLKQARTTTKIAYFDTVTATAANQMAGQLQNAVAAEQADAEPKPPVTLN
jgi:EpsD family peptidyl-prolyl cis-trans isomerase